MIKHRFYQFLFISLAFHYVAILFLTRQPIKTIDQSLSKQILVNLDTSVFPKKNKLKNPKLQHLVDLRPSYLKNGYFFKPNLNAVKEPTSQVSTNNKNSVLNSNVKELLYTESKVAEAFDLLAEKINYFLDYPTLLIENAVQGITGFDLYFDHTGNIDESKSMFFGDNKYLRGVLVRAVRQGIVKWYQNNANQLSKSQFKDQHFRAEFVISRLSSNESNLQKTNSGSYTFIRRHFKNECLYPGTVDLVCVAARAYGTIQSNLSSKYKMRFLALKDLLEHYDNLGLSGVRDTISKIL